MLTLDEILNQWIPHRLETIQTLQFAWEWMGESKEGHHVEVLVDGQLKLKGKVAAIANPMIEIGIIHARTLLEFMGLCATNGKLSQIRKRHRNDFGIEQFSTSAVPISVVTPSEAVSAYDGPIKDAENALVAIIELANKYVAHLTSGVLSAEYTDQHLDIACRGIPVLLHKHLYAKLGRTIPQLSTMMTSQRS